MSDGAHGRARAFSQKFSIFKSQASKNLGIAKQWTLQKAGKVQESPEAPEFLATLDRLHAVEASFRLLDKISASVFASDPSVRNPSKKIQQVELKKALALEGRYKIAKLDYDSRASTVAGLANSNSERKHKQLAEATEKKQDSKQALADIKQQLHDAVNALDHLKDKIHSDTVAQACSILKSVTPQWKDLPESPASLGSAPAEIAWDDAEADVEVTDTGPVGKEERGNPFVSVQGDAASAQTSKAASPSKKGKDKGQQGKGKSKKQKGKKGKGPSLIIDESLLKD